MQSEPGPVGPPPGYRTVTTATTPDEHPGYRLPPAGSPTRYFGAAEFRHMLDAARWLADHCTGLPEPLHVDVDAALRVATVTVEHSAQVTEWAARLEIEQPQQRHDGDLMQTITEARLDRHGWAFLFRAVTTAPNGPHR